MCLWGSLVAWCTPHSEGWKCKYLCSRLFSCDRYSSFCRKSWRKLPGMCCPPRQKPETEAQFTAFLVDRRLGDQCTGKWRSTYDSRESVLCVCMKPTGQFHQYTHHIQSCSLSSWSVAADSDVSTLRPFSFARTPECSIVGT